MAAFFKMPAPPGQDARAKPRPILALVWRLGADGRPTGHWRQQ